MKKVKPDTERKTPESYARKRAELMRHKWYRDWCKETRHELPCKNELPWN